MGLLDGLNEPQKKAASHTTGPLLIVAGAGTGKTRTLTHRIANLITTGVAPENILAITFTNKAAQEMKERVHELVTHLGQPGESLPFVSTFHALGVHMLRRHGKHLGIKQQFTILDPSDQTKMIKEAMKDLSFDTKMWDPRRIKNRLSYAKGDGMQPLEYTDRAESEQARVTGEVWNRYEELKKQSQTLDFDDLLTEPLRLLREHPEILDWYRKHFTHIHVDEYQDTNTVQYKLVRMLADDHKNICVVGDTDQTIYSWRGADFRNMLTFEKDYPDATMLILDTNYRSTKTILRAADDIIVKNSERIAKTLETDNETGCSLIEHTAMNGSDEARFVAEECGRLIAKGGSPQNIAILYRTNFQSRALEEAFLRAEVPYHIIGTKFFDRKEIKDALSYLRAAYNTDSRPDIARIINMPKRGIGKATIAKIFAGDAELLKGKTKEKYVTFLNLMKDIRTYGETHTAAEVIHFIIEKSGMEEAYKAGDSEDQERLENLRELVSYATRYDAHGADSIATFIEETSLLADQDTLNDSPDGAVRLMTIHASKGLEFPIVFIVGLEQGLFPSERDDSDKQQREEERRLMYVAITRAKEKLYLTHAHIRRIYGEESIQTTSEFISDISPELIRQDEEDSSRDDVPTVYLDF